MKNEKFCIIDDVRFQNEYDALILNGFIIIQLDILDQKNIYRSLKDLEIDILINNAGIGKAFSPIFKTNPDDINITTETNITSFLHLLRAVVPGMVKRKRGHIINLGSIGGLYPMAPSVYAGSKAAVHLINQNLRLELSGTGVRATEICPGRVKTEFFDVALKNIIISFLSKNTGLPPFI